MQSIGKAWGLLAPRGRRPRTTQNTLKERPGALRGAAPWDPGMKLRLLNAPHQQALYFVQGAYWLR